MRKGFLILVLALLVVSLVLPGAARSKMGLWDVYENFFVKAKYVDLTHAFMPDQPVWPGFGNAKFEPTKAGADLGSYASKGDVFTYEKHGFIATTYYIPTDQYGTQLDPPAHWDAYYPTIDELPATYCIRPLVVINIADKYAEKPGYHGSVEDIKTWEEEHGIIPEGSVVMFRSDYYKNWPAKDFNAKPFPGVHIDALKFLHNERNILFHGHEPLDTDTTPSLEGEYWLMHNGYCQAEGVMNLDKVPAVGALIAIGYAKPKGGAGGYARYIAICPPDWKYGVSIDEVPGAPLPKSDKPLHYDKAKGMRVR
ncbi:cyclase family protein [candidate division WOR-3 bacterium]|nr:cyclase family protein [candidate division WOR-3 bacterium]